ncbi:uncharacterized protein LOC114109613 [Ovis aries]|uniref:uncharacterized protein LOC114109613 n=1 Tax=Ovis aries TaxID=9940 RepID=UPI0029525F55|nr:uncharacterized protein LOC114109613 [Ovis aries]
MASYFQLIGLLGGGRLQARAPQSRWQVLMAGPSGKHNFTSPAVAGQVACHQGPEWMLGELAASTHGGPLHWPLECHMYRPCDGASHQQRTCSPANVRVLPQSGDPTPLVQRGESEPCSAIAGLVFVERQKAAGGTKSSRLFCPHAGKQRQKTALGVFPKGAGVTPGEARDSPPGSCTWACWTCPLEEEAVFPTAELRVSPRLPGNTGSSSSPGSHSTTAAGRAASPGALRAPRTFPVSGLRKPRKARKTHPGEIPDNSSVGSRERPQVQSSLPRASRSHRAPGRAETWSRPSVQSGHGPQGLRLRSKLAPAQPHAAGSRKTAAGRLGLCGRSRPEASGSWGEARFSCGCCCCLTSRGFYPH